MRVTPWTLALLLIACQGPGSSVLSPGPSASPPRTTVTAVPAPDRTRWSELASVPTARSEVAAVAFENASIYVIGGLGGARAVERYVVAGRAWEKQPDLPVALDHPMAAAVVGGTRAGIYVIGGYTDGRSSARVFRLAVGGQRWDELAPMPAARAAGAAVAIGQRIYVVGGALDARTLHRSLYVYDVGADRWSIGPDMPTPRDHLGAAAVAGVVCAVGGRTLNMSRNLGALECFDPSLDQWRRYADMPTARGGLGAAGIGDRLVAAGGERPEGTFKEVEVFDITSGTWSRGPDLAHPRHGLGLVAIGRTVYAIAGGTRPGGFTETGVVEAWELL